MEDLSLPVRAEFRSQADLKNHFHFIGNKISQKELDSAIPFFYCEENGHKENQLDQVNKY